jgi:hypothetical protein
MPPTSTDDRSVRLYLTRLLGALCLELGGEIHIPLKTLRQIADSDSRQLLVEETDLEADELVLRFGSRHSAIYPIEPEQAWASTTTPFSRAVATSPQPLPAGPSVMVPGQPPPPQAQVRAPLTDEDLAKIERRIQNLRVTQMLKREAAPRPSTDTSGASSRG